MPALARNQLGRRAYFAAAALSENVRSDDDVLADYAAEVAQLHDLPVEEVRKRFKRFMAVYHHGTDPGTEEEWSAIIGGDVEHSFIRVSKPYRFRDQELLPTALAAMARHLEPNGSRQLRVLDFGGGFGNDSIVFARTGYEAHYADMAALKNTEIVRKRFELRGLDIPVHDTHGLPPVRFDAISAIDVLEHIYDVEETAARLVARLAQGGLLVCANAFGTITYDGDHHDKNRVYVELFPHLMEAVGLERVFHAPPLEVYKRQSAPADDIASDVARLRPLLYEATRAHCEERVTRLLEVIRAAPDASFEFAALPGREVVGSAADSAARRGQRAYATAARLAPRFVKQAVWRRREAAMLSSLGVTDNPTEALGSLSDHVAVLRIAEHRLRTLRS